MPIPAILFTLKTSASSGVVGGALNVVYQWIVNGLSDRKKGKEASEEEEEDDAMAPREATGEAPDDDPRHLYVKDAIDSFAVCAVLGAVGGAALWRHIHLGTNISGVNVKAARALLTTELVWFPLVIGCVSGETQQVEDALPIMFVSTMLLMGGGMVFAEAANHYHVLQKGSFGVVTGAEVRQGLWYVGAPTCAFMLFLFASKMGELQRGKELLYDTRRVRCIQLVASFSGQSVASLCAASAVALPWIGELAFTSWFVPGCIISPLFLYCTALNIENGVSSKEVSLALAAESAEDVQQRRSTMQILPVGLLPFAWTKGRSVPVPVKLAFGGFAVLCASAYIGCQIVPYRVYLRRQRRQHLGGQVGGFLARTTNQSVREAVRGVGSPLGGEKGLGDTLGSTTFVESHLLGVRLGTKDVDDEALQQSPTAIRRKSILAGVETLDDEA
eukprot:TRINITY_DN3125_c2_g1_i1.p1 TRINITY_DN3125_c2_g1~~TRINITY_DN3125_c2_g1_i1.p1  ORF type:complete len:445 (+),score=78.59 TRINITY_DN3125_c2_g1_i1:67-1401(+)